MTKQSATSWTWLLEAEPARIRSEMQAAALALRALRANRKTANEHDKRAVIQKILSLCVEGPPSIQDHEARTLLFPLSLLLKEEQSTDSYGPYLRSLAKRPSLRSVREIDEILRPYDQKSVAPTVPGSDEPRGKRFDPQGLPDLSEALASGRSFVGDAIHWAQSRMTALPEERVSTDIWFLKFFNLSSSGFPAELAEQLFNDDEIWTAAEMEQFAAGLASPFEPDAVGLASSALLNGRLRLLRPRLFLPFPHTLVTERIGGRMNHEAWTDEVIHDVAESLLRTVRAIDKEMNPSVKRPKKETFKNVRLHLEELMARYGYAFVGVGGNLEPFDPELHVPFEPVEVGRLVKIVRPGLQKVETQTVVIPAQVSPVLEEETSV